MKLIGELRALLGESGVLTDPADTSAYTKDWKHTVEGSAACVVRPRSAGEVASVVRLASAANVSVIPQGGNTGLAAGAIPDPSGTQIVLTLSRMNAIRKLDPVGMTVEVEAGCIVQAVQDAARAAGRILPVAFAAEGSAQIGGIVSTNAGGSNVLRYGMTRQLVLGLEVVRPDGTILNGLRHLRKDNAGYDWKQLYIGSEGTLGIVTAAVLRLMPQPKFVVTSLLSVADPRAALDLLKQMQDGIGDVITAFELISPYSISIVEKHFGLKCPVAGEGWMVLLEASASVPGLREGVDEALAKVLESGIATDGTVAESETQAAQIWALRERITEAELKEGKSVKHDVSVPIPSVPGFLREAEEKLRASIPGAKINAFGHLGDGNIHFNVVVPPVTDAKVVNRLVHDIVALHEGSISAEHGIGSYRVDELERYRSESELVLMKQIKNALDPGGLLNPGKVIAGSKI